VNLRKGYSMTRDIIEIFKEDCIELGISLSQQQIDQFCKYYELLLEWNKVMNLTTITQPHDVVKKHFIDSLSIVKTDAFGRSSNMIDIGTGAGFPGIPIKIAFPEMNITLLDSLGKRIIFLNNLIEKLSLEKIKTFHGRAEDFGRIIDFREKFDLCVSRAVASLPILLEYGLPFVKNDGFFIAYKAEKAKDEIHHAEYVLSILGGETKEILEFNLPKTTLERLLIVIHKKDHVPDIFPRKAGLPLKKPIDNTFRKQNFSSETI
jgi:16S rRNA (guanine527-N7)-methyltransferase